jgi:hypothetical protein
MADSIGKKLIVEIFWTEYKDAFIVYITHIIFLFNMGLYS